MDKRIVSDINSLIQVCVTGGSSEFSSSKHIRQFQTETGLVSFIGLESVLLFQKTIDTLYSLNKLIEETVSFEIFEKVFVNLIGSLKENGQLCNEVNLKQVFDEILKGKIQTYQVLYEIYGVEMYSPFIIFGEYTFHNIYHKDSKIIEKYTSTVSSEMFFQSFKSKILVEINSDARDQKKAIELADFKLLNLEYTFSFMIGDLSHKYHIGNFDFRGWGSTTRITYLGSNVHSLNTSNNISLDVNIEDPIFSDSSNGNNRIWSLTSSKNNTKLEKRILQSIEWIGKAVYEKDKTKALILFLISIESLLKNDSQSSIINPSILNQIGDSTAFILSDNLEGRIAISKYFKELYSKRSAIVHGGNTSVTIEDLDLAKQISKGLVITFLTDPVYKAFNNISEVTEFINKLKFK